MPAKCCLILIALTLWPLTSQAVEQHTVPQGEVLLVQDPLLQPDAELLEHGDFPAAIVCRGNTQPCAVLLAIDMKTPPGNYPISLVLQQKPDVLAHDLNIVVTKKEYPEQRLTLPPEYVTPDKKTQARIARENRLIRSTVARADNRPVAAPFGMPGNGELSSRFGARRILNNLPRNQHNGVDLAINAGEKIVAIGKGKVALTGDFYLGGKSVYLDHGSGIYSMYFHLSEIRVKKGEEVKGGSIIGLVGSTGRSLGAHLHFAMQVKKARIDPLQFIRSLSQLSVDTPALSPAKELQGVTDPLSTPATDKSSD